MLDYLGMPASSLLTSPPFESWKFKRTVDDDLPEIRINYVSARNKFSFICDSDEKIRTMFVESDNLNQYLFDIPFSSSRSEVLGIFGVPSRSGAARTDPFLGKYGPWDRYDDGRQSIHIEYEPRADRIRRITLMRADVVP